MYIYTYIYIPETMRSLSQALRFHQDPAGIPWRSPLGSWSLGSRMIALDTKMLVLTTVLTAFFHLSRLFVFWVVWSLVTRT